MNERDKELAIQCRLITSNIQGIYVDTLQEFADLIRTDATEQANARANTSWALMCKKMVADEREAITSEWWSVVQGDLENGVKCLNEQAATKWRKEYPSMATFGEWLEARGNT